jgi:hypothetical protein
MFNRFTVGRVGLVLAVAGVFGFSIGVGNALFLSTWNQIVTAQNQPTQGSPDKKTPGPQTIILSSNGVTPAYGCAGDNCSFLATAVVGSRLVVCSFGAQHGDPTDVDLTNFNDCIYADAITGTQGFLINGKKPVPPK